MFAGEQRIEHGFVGVLQFAQERVAFQIGGKAAQHLEPPRHLLVQRGNARRQQAMQFEGVALLFGEGGAFIEEGIAQELIAGKRRHHLLRLSVDLRRTRHGLLRPKTRNPTISYFLRSATRPSQTPMGTAMAMTDGCEISSVETICLASPWTRLHRPCWNFRRDGSWGFG
jgi:hypothetical protein